MPRTTSVLALRVVCLQLPDSARTPNGRVIDSLCLGLGMPGRDPDIVFPADQQVAVIDTQVDLSSEADGSLVLTGPYLVTQQGPALMLRWGTLTPGGHFLLLGGTQLRLPRIVTNTEPRRRGAGAAVLTVTVTMTDPCGGPLRGTIDAVDLAWRLTSQRELVRTTPTRAPGRRSVIASTA